MPLRTFTGDPYLRGLPTNRPLIIGHRGSCGMLPEHTVKGYELAIQQGADIIECDLAVTKDLKLICAHDVWLSNVTNVKSHPEFRSRLTTRFVSGENVTDYFVIDFTFREIKTLRSIQRFSFRDQSYNGELPMASFDEYVAVAKNISNPRTVGIYPETKNPEFYNPILKQRGIKTTMEDLLLQSLRHHGYVTKDAACLVQSFSSSSLKYMSSRTALPLIQLTKKSYSDEEFAEMAEYCYGVGADKTLMVDEKNNTVKGETDFLKRAHAAGLKVHGFTFRDENRFLAWNYGQDPYREYQLYIRMGIDGLFTDFSWSLSNFMRHF